MKRFFLICLGAVFLGSSASAAPDHPAARIEFKADPEFSTIEPAHHGGRNPGHYTLSVVDDAGHPIPNVRLKYTLYSPPKNAFFSSDFPIVEATTLMEGDVVLPNGTFSYDYLTPIRGDYRLVVEAEPAGNADKDHSAFAPVRQEIRYHINETPAVVRNGAILFGGLFLIGFVSGFVIARPRALRPTAAVAAIAIALELFGADGVSAHSHGDNHTEPAKPVGGTVTSVSAGQDYPKGQDLPAPALSVAFDPPGAVVGKLVAIRGSLKDPAGHPIPNVRISIKLHHIEDDKTMYEGSFFSPDGTFEWKNQFFDGAEHDVIVTVTPTVAGAFSAVTAKYTIGVEAICPPANIQIRTWTFLMMITSSGMALGAGCARRFRFSYVA